MIKYTKLFHIMLDRNINVNELRKMTGISQPTVSKLRKGELIQSDVQDKICRAFGIQPGDWMEWIDADMPSKKGSDKV